jgi:hypothetical protein
MAGTKATAAARLDGVAIGVLMGFAADGAPLVVFAGNREDMAVPVRTTARLGTDDVGRDVALLFEGGDPARPLLIGRIEHPDGPPRVAVERDGERLELVADREIVLRCGKASITLTAAGKIVLRGAYILSRSTGVNRIKGGSVQLN